jgi:hypothetical protein
MCAVRLGVSSNGDRRIQSLNQRAEYRSGMHAASINPPKIRVYRSGIICRMLKGCSRANGEERRIRRCADIWQPVCPPQMAKKSKAGKRHARDEAHCINALIRIRWLHRSFFGRPKSAKFGAFDGWTSCEVDDVKFWVPHPGDSAAEVSSHWHLQSICLSSSSSSSNVNCPILALSSAFFLAQP